MTIEGSRSVDSIVHDNRFAGEACNLLFSGILDMKQIIDRLEKAECLTRDEWILLLSGYRDEDRVYAAEKARRIAGRYFGNRIYIRGLIEFTGFCKNNCYYCGLRRENEKAQRYRLTEEEILSCCEQGYKLGFRTFVLQGGEDAWYTDARIEQIIRLIKGRWPDCALTLSIGEREEASYRLFYEAGADRYLLRHETGDRAHYGRLHPPEMSFDHRKDCLRALKKTGFQTGCGFMVGSPGQCAQTLAEDMLWIQELRPHMIGIGPFIPHRDTPFGQERAGDYQMTLFLLSLLRIMGKQVLLPATTALGTIHPGGREAGILAGANVVMPNLSPVSVRRKYAIYDHKLCMDAEAAEGLADLEKRLRQIGYETVSERGDWKGR